MRMRDICSRQLEQLDDALPVEFMKGELAGLRMAQVLPQSLLSHYKNMEAPNGEEEE